MLASSLEVKLRTVLDGQLAGGLEARVVDRLEDLLVELLRLGRVEGQAEEDEGVGQALLQKPGKSQAGAQQHDSSSARDGSVGRRGANSWQQVCPRRPDACGASERSICRGEQQAEKQQQEAGGSREAGSADLHAHADGAVAHVGAPRGVHRVVVHVDDLVQVARHLRRHLRQRLEVEVPVWEREAEFEVE